jgi:hypothetical protein
MGISSDKPLSNNLMKAWIDATSLAIYDSYHQSGEICMYDPNIRTSSGGRDRVEIEQNATINLPI